jgi:hypothetical protein
LILARAAMKSSIQTSGQRSKAGFTSINVMSLPAGSEGKVGIHPPSAVYLNLLPVWHFLTGIISASLTTIAISDPE